MLFYVPRHNSLTLPSSLIRSRRQPNHSRRSVDITVAFRASSCQLPVMLSFVETARFTEYEN